MKDDDPKPAPQFDLWDTVLYIFWGAVLTYFF